MYLTLVGKFKSYNFVFNLHTYACRSSVNILYADCGPSKHNIPRIPNTSPSVSVQNGFSPFPTYLFFNIQLRCYLEAFSNLFLLFLWNITFTVDNNLFRCMFSSITLSLLRAVIVIKHRL